MGIIPVPTEYGDDCTLCFDARKTPHLVKAFFSGIAMGVNWNPVNGPPPNGYYDLINTAESPCTWKNDVVDFPFVTFTLADGRSSLKIISVGVQTSFLSSVFEDCIFHFTNDLLCAFPNTFCGGYGYVATAANLAAHVESVTPIIDPDPRMECFPMSDQHIAIRYAGKDDDTNISIKVDVS